jgi:hypothetical protein
MRISVKKNNEMIRNFNFIGRIVILAMIQRYVNGLHYNYCFIVNSSYNNIAMYGPERRPPAPSRPDRYDSGRTSREHLTSTELSWGIPNHESVETMRRHYSTLGYAMQAELVLTSTEDPAVYRQRRGYIMEGLVRYYRDKYAPDARTYEVNYDVLPIAIVDMPPVPDRERPIYSNRLVFFRNGEGTHREDFTGMLDLILTYANNRVQTEANAQRIGLIPPIPRRDRIDFVSVP